MVANHPHTTPVRRNNGPKGSCYYYLSETGLILAPGSASIRNVASSSDIFPTKREYVFPFFDTPDFICLTNAISIFRYAGGRHPLGN